MHSLRHPSQIKWRTAFYYMDSCGADAMPIIGLLGLLIGVILAFQAIVQLSRFGVDSFVVNLVGTIISTELAPLVTAVVLAGRTGSSFASELGLMKSREELDAMTTLGFDVGRFELIPKVLALIFVMPGLTIISDVCGIVGGMIIVCSMLDTSIAEYLGKTFEVIQPIDLAQGLVKSVVFAGIVASVGCWKGLSAERDAQGVGKATTSSVVTSIFLIVVTDAAMTAIFSFIS
jgi:phospholipid/cholesterol/gamma-HCH transport system permease protein